MAGSGSVPKWARRHCQVNTGRRQLTDGIPVSTPPLSTRDHQPCRLVVPSVHSELSRCRRSSRGAWRHRILGNHSILVPQVWTSLCSYFAATTRSTWRHLARGRSVHHHPRRTSLSLESGEPGRRRRRTRQGSAKPCPNGPALDYSLAVAKTALGSTRRMGSRT